MSLATTQAHRESLQRQTQVTTYNNNCNIQQQLQTLNPFAVGRLAVGSVVLGWEGKPNKPYNIILDHLLNKCNIPFKSC